jgi:hypothetical protein
LSPKCSAICETEPDAPFTESTKDESNAEAILRERRGGKVRPVSRNTGKARFLAGADQTGGKSRAASKLRPHDAANNQSGSAPIASAAKHGGLAASGRAAKGSPSRQRGLAMPMRIDVSNCVAESSARGLVLAPVVIR